MDAQMDTRDGETQEGGILKQFKIFCLCVINLLLVISLTACEKERSGVVAEVGSEKITENELLDAFQRKADLLGINGITPEMKQEVLDLMIERSIMYLYAKEQGMKVPEKELVKKSSELTPDEAAKQRKAIQRQLLIQMAWSEITKDEAITSEEVEDYYRGHQQEFSLPDRYKVYLVKVDKDNAGHVLVKAKEDPQAFNDMALNTSSPELVKINENAPFTPKEGFPDEMAPLLERVQKGDIAGPVDVARGLFIFKLVDKEPAHIQSLPEVSTRIKHTLAEQKRNEKFKTWYDKAKEKYKIKIFVQDLGTLDK